jgi:hypothetical protein
MNQGKEHRECLWCGKGFERHCGGSPQRFCSAAHRTAFWSALRRWAERAVAADALTVDHIRNADPAGSVHASLGCHLAEAGRRAQRAAVNACTVTGARTLRIL